MELDIWAILWPVLKQVFGLMGLDQKAISTGVFILCWIVSGKILSFLKPQYRRGAVLSEILHILWSAVTFLLPFVLLIWWLKEQYPLLGEAVSFVASKFSWQQRLFSWVEIFVIAVIFVAIQRFFIHKGSLLLQKVFSEVPVLGNLLIGIVLMLEGLLFLASAVALPVNMILLAKDRGVLSSVALGAPTLKPQGVASDDVWDAITTGVGMAQANGVSCDPYLILAIKEYETGSNLCDSSMAGSRSCVSGVGASGMMQFMPETFQRNSERRDVGNYDLWSPEQSVEVACYFMKDEVGISLEQSRGMFVEEFSSTGFVWNADPEGAAQIYDRATALKRSAMEVAAKETSVSAKGYIWPAPAGSYVSYAWGAEMSYGTHNGIDIVLPGIPQFQVVAVADGKARYWDGGSCNAGVVGLEVPGGETLLYVHMSLVSSEMEIPTNGSWVDVKQGQVIGWIHNGTTTCSDGPHLHLMRSDGTQITAGEFQR